MNSHEKELRIGLVLYGGVSLCMYIFGVVYEFLRFVRREGAYKELSDEAGIIPRIDVISGTSAGGINGIFLAKAITTGASLDSLKSLWIDEGDLDKLINQNKKPVSLLDSEYYVNKLESALNKLKPNPEKISSFRLMDLFITATDLDGVIKKFEGTSISHPVVTKGYDTVFHFKLRPERYEDAIALSGDVLNKNRTGRNDFAGEKERDKNRYLAKIAAATSAFPVAFAPVSFSTDEKREMKKLFQGHVCRGNVKQNTVYGDGGMINNRPFNYTVQTIFNRQADTIVDRKLFFVEPDPETLKLMDSKKIRLADREATDGFDSLKGLFEAGLYQSIAEDLTNLFDRNKKIIEVKSVIHSIEHELSKYICGQDEDCKKIIRNNPIHKIYMDYKIHKLIPEIAENFYSRISDKKKLQDLKDFIDKKLADLSQDPVTFLTTFDYPFRIRRIRYFISKVNSWFRENELEKSVIDQLSIVKMKLYNFVEYYNHESWRISEHGTRITWEDREKAFDEIIGEFKNLMSPDMKEKAKQIVAEIDDFNYKYKLDDLNISLIDVYDAYEFLDMHLFPILVLSDTGEADPIEVVRISPDLATHYSDGKYSGSKAIAEKLAGEKLMHFSAFLKKSWRENDILQGRLDAAEIIANTVLEDTDPGKAKNYVSELCKGIVEEELKSILLRCKDTLTNLVISEGDKESIQKILEEKYGLNVEASENYFMQNYKVGMEELKDIQKVYLLRVAAKALKTFGLMLHRFPEKSSPHLSSYVAKPVNIISRVNNYIYSLVMAFTGELKQVFKNIVVFLVFFITSLLIFSLLNFINIKDPMIWGVIALLGIWLIVSSKILKVGLTILYIGFLVYYLFASGKMTGISKFFSGL